MIQALFSFMSFPHAAGLQESYIVKEESCLYPSNKKNWFKPPG